MKGEWDKAFKVMAWESQLFIQTQFYQILKASVVHYVLRTNSASHNFSREGGVEFDTTFIVNWHWKIHVLRTSSEFVNFLKAVNIYFPPYLHTFCLHNIYNIFNPVPCLWDSKCLVNICQGEYLSTLTLKEFSLVQRIWFCIDYLCRLGIWEE